MKNYDKSLFNLEYVSINRKKEIKMDIENKYEWKVIIKSIIHSQALKEYDKHFKSFISSTKQYEQELENLGDKKQKITEKLNSKLLTIPLIAILVKYWIDFKIKNCNQEIKELITNHNSNIKKMWRIVWKEILKFYYYDKKYINSEHFKNWQDDFIINCQLLITKWKEKFINNCHLLFEKLQSDNDMKNFEFSLKKWQNENDLIEICQSLLEKWKDQNQFVENCNLVKKISKYCFLITNGQKVCDIVRSLVTDVCSDFEFQRVESLNIIGNNQFLKVNIAKEDEHINNNWNQDLKTACNASTSNLKQSASSKSTYLKYVNRR